MSLEEEFNNEIKNKLDSRSFEYHEASWEKANALIQDAQKKKKRRFFFYLLSLGVILTGIIFSLQYPFNKIENSIAKKETTENITKDQNSDSIETIKQSPTSANETNNNLEIVNKELPKEKPNKEVKQEEKITSSSSISNATIKNVEKNKGNLSTNNLIADANYNEQTKGKAELKITSMPKTKSKISASKESSNRTFKTQDADIKENGKVEAEIKNIKKDSLVDEKPIEVVKTTLPAKDSTPIVTTNTPGTETKKDSTKKKIDKLQIFAFAGVAFTPGYVKPISIKESVNPSVGILVHQTLKPDFGIGIGLFYTIYGNISENPKVFKNTSQDFGYKNETTEIKQSRLHYLKLPLMFDYSKGKNNFILGAQFMYLVTGSSNVTTYKESYGLKTDNSSKKVYGYINGLSPYDVSIIAGYRRQITNKISLQILVDFGFMDVKNNTYFNSMDFDRNKSLQLNLGYKLFSK